MIPHTLLTQIQSFQLAVFVSFPNVYFNELFYSENECKINFSVYSFELAVKERSGRGNGNREIGFMLLRLLLPNNPSLFPQQFSLPFCYMYFVDSVTGGSTSRYYPGLSWFVV